MTVQSLTRILVLAIGLLFPCVVTGVILIRWITTRVYGQVGERREWYKTVAHDSNGSPCKCWQQSIAELEAADGELLREWGSHDEIGGRNNREYGLQGTIVLLELDRWNGFTISGKRDVVQPIAECAGIVTPGQGREDGDRKSGGP